MGEVAPTTFAFIYTRAYACSMVRETKVTVRDAARGMCVGCETGFET
jgi:hypothetical protein